jgi:hypothetical protein
MKRCTCGLRPIPRLGRKVLDLTLDGELVIGSACLGGSSHGLDLKG